MQYADDEQWREALQHLLAVRQFQQAEALARRRIALYPEEAAAYASLGLTILRQPGREAEAQVVVRQALALDPENGDAHHYHSMALHRQSQSEAALQAIDEALRLNAHEPVYLGYKAGILNTCQRAAEALQVAEAGLAINPRHQECLYQRIRALSGPEHREAADLAKLEFVRLYPNAPVSHYFLGTKAFRELQFEASVEHLRECIRLDPTNMSAQDNLLVALRGLGDIFLLRGDGVQARPYYLEVWELAPGDAQACLGLQQVAGLESLSSLLVSRTKRKITAVLERCRQFRVGALVELGMLIVPLLLLFSLPLVLLYLWAQVRWRRHPDFRLVRDYAASPLRDWYLWTLLGIAAAEVLGGWYVGWSTIYSMLEDASIAGIPSLLIVGPLLLIIGLISYTWHRSDTPAASTEVA